MVTLAQTVSVVAGTAGLAFLGYCIYFDRKRRLDPKYQEKLRERRKRQRGNGAGGGLPMAGSGSSRKLPDLNDPQACQAYFLAEIQEGEAKLATGMIDEGISHLTNAIAMCGQPHQLLQVLQQTLPPQVFQKLIQQLPGVAMRIPQSSQGPTIQEEEDDIE